MVLRFIIWFGLTKLDVWNIEAFHVVGSYILTFSSNASRNRSLVYKVSFTTYRIIIFNLCNSGSI